MKLVQAPDREGVLQLRLVGQPGGRFLETFQRLVAAGSAVVLDLSRAEAFRGDDLEELVLAHHHCESGGGGLVLAGLRADLRYIIGLLELDQFFNIEDTPEAATAALQRQAASTPMTTRRMVALRKEQLAALAPHEVDAEEAARRQVHGIKASIYYLAPTPQRIEILRWLTQQGGAVLDPATAARETGCTPAEVEQAFARLQALRVLVDRGGLRFLPRSQVHELVRDILVMWKEPANRQKMMEWATAGP